MVDKILNPKSQVLNQNTAYPLFIDKVITYLYYSLFTITPLIMTAVTSELFEFNKMLFIYLVTILISFCWLLKIILTKKIIFKRTPLDIPICVFLASQILSTLFSIDRHTSLFGYYGRFNGGLISIIAYLLLFYGFINNFSFDFEKAINKILQLSWISSLIVILWGLPGKFGHDLSCLLFMGQFNNNCWTDQFRPAERMFSTLGQPNWLGAYLAINFFIGVYFLLRTKNKKYFILNTCLPAGKALYLILNLLSILFTRSRSALISVIIGLLILFIYRFYALIKIVLNKYRLFFIAGIIVLLLASIFYLRLSKAKNTSGITESFDIRKIVWEGAIKLGLKYPIFGSGVETFAYAYYFVRPVSHNLTSEWDFLYNKAHNEYLNYFATTGFVGLGSYLFLIGSIIYFSWIKFKSPSFAKASEGKQNLNDNNKLLICLLLAWLTILITNFFGFSITVINLYFYLIPAFILAINMTDNNYLLNKDLKFDSKQTKLFIASLIVIYLYLLLRLITYFIADIDYAKADTYTKIGNYQGAANLLDSALRLKYEHVYEDKLSNVLANLSFIASYQKETDTTSKLIVLSDYYNQKTLKATPKNVLYWKTRAKNQYLYYQITLNKKYIEEGINSLIEAKKLSPTDPKIPYSLAIFYSLLTDEVKDQKKLFQDLAISNIKAAILLKPDYRDGYFLKGQLLKKYGDKEGARKAFQYILDNFNSNDAESKKEIAAL